MERYADIFRSMGYSVELSHQLRPISTEKEGIGFALFAQHFGKMFPIEKSFELAKEIAKNKPLYFFGGGQKEIEILTEWEKEIPNSTSLAGKLSLKEELDKISKLELMISMDSANMHLASLVGTRCISVWGQTKLGVVGAFGDRYGDTVKVYQMGEGENRASFEICGGPHVDHTGQLAQDDDGTPNGKRFKITKEGASSAGVRRVKAVI